MILIGINRVSCSTLYYYQRLKQVASNLFSTTINDRLTLCIGSSNNRALGADGN